MVETSGRWKGEFWWASDIGFSDLSGGFMTMLNMRKFIKAFTYESLVFVVLCLNKK